MNRPNPIIAGFYPDPSICRVGDEYYVAASSFAYFPGAPIFRSSDLGAWVQIGNALDRPAQLDLSATDGSVSLGMYAPTLRHHDGRFWLITTNVTRNGSSTFYVTADDPAGEWSDPTFVAVEGFDPDLAWDDDGTCFVHISDMATIVRYRIDDETGAVLGPGEPAWAGTGMWCPEAPHLFQRDGLWYLVIAEGGTERGHCVSIARASSPEGPWENCPANPILSHRSTGSPIKNTGHADLVQAPDGSWWMVLLGVRPKGPSPGFHVLGRETFLVPIAWVDGWPVPGDLELGSVDAVHRPAGFSGGLGPEWVSLRRSPLDCSSVQDGRLQLIADGFVARRQEHHRMKVRAQLHDGDALEAGVTLFMEETHRYDICRRGDQVVARCTAGALSSTAATTAPDGPVVLTIETRPHPNTPDLVALGYEDAAGAEHVLAEVDGRYLSTEVVGGFTGRVIAMYARGGNATFDWFEYEPDPPDRQEP